MMSKGRVMSLGRNGCLPHAVTRVTDLRLLVNERHRARLINPQQCVTCVTAECVHPKFSRTRTEHRMQKALTMECLKFDRPDT